MQRIILKISGEVLCAQEKAISLARVKKIAKEIKALYDLGNIQLGIICGAGNIWRGRAATSAGMKRLNADYMGILGTILNAFALQNALEQLGLDARVLTSVPIPQIAEPYTQKAADFHLNQGRICLFGGGTGSPFFSTDTAAALRAAELGCTRILMAKNGTDGIYDKDPQKYKNARKFQKITYQELLDRKLGVMDLTAATLCAENNIEILVFDINGSGNMKKAVADATIGTLVTAK